MRTLGRERGQVLALTMLMLVALLGMSAMVLDVGSWYRAKRRLQATADAAALAGAQALPSDPAGAVSLALRYADANGGDVPASNVVVTSDQSANDRITVRASRTAPGFFSRVLNIDAVDIGAEASARAAPLTGARYVAPIVVSELHPLLQCKPEPCFGQSTTIGLANLKDPGSSTAAGSFGLIDLRGGSSGSVGAGTLADWLQYGYSGTLRLGDYGDAEYDAVPGAKFNSGEFKGALADRVGDELLFPVYRSIEGSGSNAVFHIIGWVGFVLRGFSGTGSTGTLQGEFTRVTWDGETNGAIPSDFGVRTVELVQ